MPEQDGGFVRNERFRQPRTRRKIDLPRRVKTHDDLEEEARSARRRWADMPPLVAAREMISEANLPESVVAELSAAIAKMKSDELEQLVNSGKLSQYFG